MCSKKIILNNSGFRFIYKPNYSFELKTYTFSAYMYVSSDYTGSTVGCYLNGSTHRVKYDLTKLGTWQKLSITVSVTTAGIAETAFCPYYGENATGTIFVTMPKCEIGNKPSDYTEAPEDTQGQIDTINTNYTSLNQTVNSISANVSSLQTSTSDLGTRMTSAESSIIALNNSITLKVATSDFTSYQATVSNNFTTTNGNVTTAQNTANTALSTANGIQVGSRNLLLNSDFKASVSPWASQGNHSIIMDASVQYNSKNSIKIVSSGVGSLSTDRAYVYTIVPVPTGQPAIISFWAKTSSTVTISIRSSTTVSILNISTTWTKYTVVCPGTDTNDRIVLCLNTAGTIWVCIPKFEQGNKATDWTPAPEDTQGQLDSATTRITSTESSISILQGQIVTKVDSNGVQSIIPQSASQVQIAFNQINSANVKVDTAGLTIGTGYFKIVDNSDQILFVRNDGLDNNGIELGSYTKSNVPYFDFHSSGVSSVDYDARIMCQGGNSTVGRGTLTFAAVTASFTGNISASGYISTPDTISTSSSMSTSSLTASGVITAYDFHYSGGAHSLYSYNITRFEQTSSTQLTIYANGTTYGATTWASDISLKMNIIDYSGSTALAKIMAFKHKEYDWKDGSGHVSIGYVSQELMMIDKALVTEVKQENGKPSLYEPDVTTIIPTITLAMQELKLEKDNDVNELKREISSLKLEIQNLKSRIAA